MTTLTFYDLPETISGGYLGAILDSPSALDGAVFADATTISARLSLQAGATYDVILEGDFIYGGLGTLKGTVTSITFSVEGYTELSIPDLSADAAELWLNMMSDVIPLLSGLLDGDDVIVAASSALHVNTGDGNDDVTGSPQVDIIDGGIGDNILRGLGGNDKLQAGSGNDTLLGGDGNDYLSSGGGNDVLFGGNGDDVLRSRAGRNLLNGGAGDDNIIGGVQRDKLHGGTGDDDLSGSAGNDRLFGDSGNDRLSGNDGRDFLSGGDGNDILDGSFKQDELFGGNGDDTLVGHYDDDILTGGDGADEFLFPWFGKARGHGQGDYVITDFDPTEDNILLHSRFVPVTLTQIDTDVLITSESGLSTITVQNAIVSEIEDTLSLVGKLYW